MRRLLCFPGHAWADHPGRPGEVRVCGRCAGYQVLRVDAAGEFWAWVR